MKYLIFSISLHLIAIVIGFTAIFKRNKPIPPSPTNQKIRVKLASNFKKINKALVDKNLNVKKNKLKKTIENPLNHSSKTQLKSIQEQTNKISSTQNTSSKLVSLSYIQELKAYLEKSKHYPRQAIRLKQSGIVEVKVRIDANGNFNEVKLTKSSTFPLLNQAAINLFKNLGSFKPLPKSIPPNSNFTIPIAYVMGQVK